MSRHDDSFYYYQPTRARAVKGGIKAHSRRGHFVESWWGRRWLEVLESFNIGERLARGRSYARKGQVLDLSIEPSKITAKVQGSRPTPYRVTISIEPIPAAAWKKLGAAVGEDTWSAARLIAGDMPEALEEIFQKAGMPLFPVQLDDLKTDCSCPDWSNPCKHIAAAYYLLAERFDRDPFLLFRLRGTSREAFLALLGEAGPAPVAKASAPPPQPLAIDPRTFWQGRPVPDDLFGAAAAIDTPVPASAALGPLPFWRGETNLIEAMAQATTRAAPAALRVALSDKSAG
jgi:uncharacterized Zn finger protein